MTVRKYETSDMNIRYERNGDKMPSDKSKRMCLFILCHGNWINLLFFVTHVVDNGTAKMWILTTECCFHCWVPFVARNSGINWSKVDGETHETKAANPNSLSLLRIPNIVAARMFRHGAIRIISEEKNVARRNCSWQMDWWQPSKLVAQLNFGGCRRWWMPIYVLPSHIHCAHVFHPHSLQKLQKHRKDWSNRKIIFTNQTLHITNQRHDAAKSTAKWLLRNTYANLTRSSTAPFKRNLLNKFVFFLWIFFSFAICVGNFGVCFNHVVDEKLSTARTRGAIVENHCSQMLKRWKKNKFN